MYFTFAFYFVSDSSEVINLLFFSLLPGFFSNLQISAFLTIFLDRMISLLLKYNMIIFFSVIYPVSGFFRFFSVISGFYSNLQISSFLSIFLERMISIFLKYDMILFYLLSGFFRFFSGFYSNLQISAFLTIFLVKMISLIVKYDIMISFQIFLWF